MNRLINKIKGKIRDYFIKDYIKEVKFNLERLSDENIKIKQENLNYKERLQEITLRANAKISDDFKITHLKDEEGLVWVTSEDPHMTTYDAFIRMQNMMKNLCPKIKGVILTRDAGIEQLPMAQVEKLKDRLVDILAKHKEENERSEF